MAARQERSARGLDEAPAALMGSLLAIFGDPRIKVGLQLADGSVDLLAERHPVELIQDGAMKALTDSIGLRAFGLGATVIDVLDREVELVVVAFTAAEFGAPVSQHARQPDAVLVVKWHHPVIEDLGRGDRGLAVVQLGEGDLHRVGLSPTGKAPPFSRRTPKTDPWRHRQVCRPMTQAVRKLARSICS